MTPDEINKILGSRNVLLSLTVTGGGMTGISDLFTAPGSSKFIHQFSVPYGKEAFDRTIKGFMQEEDFKYVSLAAAEALGESSLAEMESDLSYEKSSKRLFGVGVTAKLTTGPGERKGREHVVLIYAVEGENPFRGVMKPDSQTRAGQEKEAAEFIQQFLLTITDPEHTKRES